MKAILIGQGKMAAQLEEVLHENGHEVLAKTDILDETRDHKPWDQADVIIDFSHKNNLPFTLEKAVLFSIPAVIGTTGLDDMDKEALKEASRFVPVFYASNYSLGIALLTALAKQASKVLKGKWDIEVSETHHNQKQDAPSGTAISLVDAMDPEHEYKRVCGRKGMQPRTKKEIGIHSLRGGTVAGDHTVYFFGDQEQIELGHKANNRKIFACGALEAADFVKDKENGLWSMNDLLGLEDA